MISGTFVRVSLICIYWRAHMHSASIFTEDDTLPSYFTDADAKISERTICTISVGLASKGREGGEGEEERWMIEGPQKPRPFVIKKCIAIHLERYRRNTKVGVLMFLDGRSSVANAQYADSQKQEYIFGGWFQPTTFFRFHSASLCSNNWISFFLTNLAVNTLITYVL